MAKSASLVTSLTHLSTFSPTNSPRNYLDPRAAPKCLWPSMVTLIAGVSKHLPGSLFSFRFDDQATCLGIREVTQRRATLIVVIVAMKILVSLCILNRHKLQKNRQRICCRTWDLQQDQISQIIQRRQIDSSKLIVLRPGTI